MWIKLFASGAESKLHHNSYLAKMSKLKPVLLCQQSDRQSAKEKLLEHAQGTGKPIHVHDAPQLIKRKSVDTSFNCSIDTHEAASTIELERVYYTY